MDYHHLLKKNIAYSSSISNSMFIKVLQSIENLT